MWPGTPVALWMKRHNRWMWQRQRAQTVYNNRKYVRPAVKTFKSVSCCGSRASTSRRRQLPRCSPHQEAPRGERPAGFHRINKTVTHKDRRRKGQTLVHNRRATARPKELSECSWRTDSHTHTQTSTSNLCTCSYWRLCVSLTSAWFSSFGVKRFIQETLTHLAILYKQHADGVLGAEVEYVNVVLNGHLREWLHPRRGGREEDDRMRNKKQYVGNYFTSALQGWALLVYVCCLLNQEGCSPEKSLPLSQTHRPPITLDLKSKFAKEYQQTSLDYIKHNSFLLAA